MDMYQVLLCIAIAHNAALSGIFVLESYCTVWLIMFIIFISGICIQYLKLLTFFRKLDDCHDGGAAGPWEHSEFETPSESSWGGLLQVCYREDITKIMVMNNDP